MKILLFVLFLLVSISIKAQYDSVAYLVVTENPRTIRSDTLHSIDSVNYLVEYIFGVPGVGNILHYSDYFELRSCGVVIYCEKKRVVYNRRGRIKLKRIK